YTVQNKSYTRLGSMKHLEQLFGEEEFIRITTTLLVPFQYIQSCQDNVVVMKKMPWKKSPTAFQLEPKTGAEIAERIAEFMRLKDVVSGGKEGAETSVSTVSKRKPASPPDEKIREVLSYIEHHANCNSADIIAGTKYSLSTVERCLSELRKQGLIEHTGSKKSGGYRTVH
ncbi:MAG: winged helix-turn-helix domain-containing protein, partial [Bacteroidales bacterium]|nr:winged helix-turn-helix domain-containing protein [Bacteroidales bacterium]